MCDDAGLFFAELPNEPGEAVLYALKSLMTCLTRVYSSTEYMERSLP